MATMLTAVPSAEPMRSPQEPDPYVPERAHLRRFSAFYKQKILSEYEGLGKAGKGALLRREGLYSSLISEWRKQRDQGALAVLTQKRGRAETDPREREVVRLRKELAHVERELDKARKVIEIQAARGRLTTGAGARRRPGQLGSGGHSPGRSSRLSVLKSSTSSTPSPSSTPLRRRSSPPSSTRASTWPRSRPCTASCTRSTRSGSGAGSPATRS